MKLPALLLAATLALAAAAAHAGCNIPVGSPAMQAELLQHLNAERRAKGLSPLRLNPTLSKAAQGHACDNAKRMTTSHVSSDGSRLKNRLRRVGYSFSIAAENTGRGFASGARAIEWWMNSPGHRNNILLKDLREVGIGIAMSAAPDSRLHWIINLGAEG